LGAGLLLRFLAPLGQQGLAQAADLFDGARFGFMGADALGHGGIHHVGNLPQTLAQVRLLGEGLVQTA